MMVGMTMGHKLQGQVASARVLVGLHAGNSDQQFDPVFRGLFLDRLMVSGPIAPSQSSSQMTVSRKTLRSAP